MQFKNRLPFFWGNKFWALDHSKLLKSKGELGKRNKNRFDYSKVQLSDNTDIMLKEEYPHHDFRKKLHKQIISSYLNRVKGAESNRHCIFFFGGTASGKSSLLGYYQKNLKENPDIREQYKEAITVNYDEIKLHLPEYSHMIDCKLKYAAPYVQSESAKIFGKLLKKCIANDKNILCERTLSKTKITKENIRALRKKGYTLIAFVSFVDTQTALDRAEKRYKQTGRWVPPDIIRATYQKVPSNVEEVSELLDLTILYDNRGEGFQRVYVRVPNKSLEIVNQQLYEEYLDITRGFA